MGQVLSSVYKAPVLQVKVYVLNELGLQQSPSQGNQGAVSDVFVLPLARKVQFEGLQQFVLGQSVDDINHGILADFDVGVESINCNFTLSK